MTQPDGFVEFCVRITGARLFGHGRRVELLFSICSGLYAVELLFMYNGTAGRTVVTEDVFWGGYGRYMLVVMWALFIVTSLGLWFNIKAIPGSQMLRLLGAFLGFWVWGWFGVKLTVLGIYPSPGQVVCCVLAFVGETMVMFNAAANLPRPGAPGNVGGYGRN